MFLYKFLLMNISLYMYWVHILCDCLFIVEVLWGHTTDSMCVGFMSSTMQKPKVQSRKPPNRCLVFNTMILKLLKFSTYSITLTPDFIAKC